jgi:ATP-dependent exoDNAse (exonuclease V) beta subunit
VRDEAAEKGTFIHAQIENFLKGNEFDADSKEFGFFNDFYINEVQKRHLIFFDAEKKIFSNRYNVAGTIDCLFKKKDRDEYVMLDWKRSKKLVIDGRPRIFGYGNAASELSHLDNSSYYRYCLQQNIYKIIAESEFSIKISSMKLVVLHENYSTYHFVNVPEMKREAMIILNSLNLKI